MMPMVLVPGYMLDETLWDDVLPLLPAVPVVHGSLREGGTVEDMARHILAACPPRFVLAGFSMGGYIAREMARLAPARVQSLVLISTSSRPDTAQQREQRAKAALNTPVGPFRGLSRGAIVTSLHPGHASKEALIARVRAMGSGLGREVFIRQSLLERGDTARLGEIACPTLVIAAAQDQMRSRAEAEELREGIPGATLAVVEDSGHLIPLEQPAALAALIHRASYEIQGP
ncbi:alpha/beta hydrolase [Pseudoduganella sp. LjRoot289]|uniref:alpha/beta fold hydrolase n=1 Tax=Pseudoduganella sp. LjRoot289 TaxID=3342314 RepID=UPI003ED021CD